MRDEGRKMREWERGVRDESEVIPSLIPHSSSLLRRHELSLGRRGNYSRVRVSPAKKKRERDFGADRSIRESGGERQYHCRVPARLGNKVNRVVGDRACFGIRRLPRGRDLVHCGGVGEVGAADGNLRVGVDFLVFGAAHALQMLNRCASTCVINAVPVELARLAAKIRLDLGADMNLVIRSDHARFGVAFPRQHGVDAQPTIEGDVASILAESLHSFKKTAYDAKVRVELTSDNVAVVHGEAQTACGVVRFLVRDEETENLLCRVSWINPGYHPVVEGRLGSRTNHYVCHLIFTSIWHPFGFSRPAPSLAARPRLLSGTSETARKDADSLAFSHVFTQDGLILKSNSAIKLLASVERKSQ